MLSTFIATLGLYLNSAAVIIGAMVLAPLMSPMVSISMALLRANDKLFWRSLEKIALGTALVLGAAALTSLIFPHEPMTFEMIGRLHPSLPDLFIAIFSGIAAAYARSFKEIVQNLAGVITDVAVRAAEGESGLMITIEVQEPLDRQDLAELKRQIRAQLDDDFTIRLDIHYKL